MTKKKFKIVLWSILVGLWSGSWVVAVLADYKSSLQHLMTTGFLVLSGVVLLSAVGYVWRSFWNWWDNLPEQ